MVKSSNEGSWLRYRRWSRIELSVDGLTFLKVFLIQKADKDSSVVLVHRDVYVKHMENILNDNTKFERVDIKTRTLNFQVSHEKRINEILKSLKSSGSLW